MGGARGGRGRRSQQQLQVYMYAWNTIFMPASVLREMGPGSIHQAKYWESGTWNPVVH